MDLTQITGGAGFGMRMHPIFKVQRMHDGIDIARKEGTPVYAVADGTVVVSKMQGNGKGYGNYIVIDHGDYYSLYAHLKARAIVTGKKVEGGYIIGFVGNTGDSQGSHLHFGLCKSFLTSDRGWFDPLPYLKMIKESEENEVRYNKVAELPEWAKPTIQKLMTKGLLKGDEKGNLNLSEDMVRMLVILDRANIF